MKSSLLLLLITFISFINIPKINSIEVNDSLEQYRYLDNGIIKVGVDIKTGGCIFYVGKSGVDYNYINYRDNGRYIQQSYYGERDGSMWAGKPWTWNPIQGGGCGVSGAKKAKVLKSKINNKKIYIKTMPKHWATSEDIKDLIFEQKIDLKANLIHVKYRVENIGNKNHAIANHELPAIFLDFTLCKLALYNGDRPWSNDTLTITTPPFNNKRFGSVKENWAAFVNETGNGIGFLFPGTDSITTYRRGKGESIGSKGSNCSYFAPIKRFALKAGMKYDYELFIILGNIQEIRENFRKINITNKSK